MNVSYFIFMYIQEEQSSGKQFVEHIHQLVIFSKICQNFNP